MHSEHKWVPFPQFLHSSVNGHLGCFYLLAVVSNAAMNIGDSICLRSAFYSFRYRITELYGNSLFNFLRDCQTGFPQQLAVASYTPTSNVQGFHFLQVLAKTCCFPFFFYF